MTFHVNIQPSMSFGLIVVSGVWACMQCYSDCGAVDYWTCSNIAYLFVIFFGLSGFWKYGRGTTKDRSPKIYHGLKFLVNTYLISLICVDLYMFNSFSFRIAYMHLLYPMVAWWYCINNRRPHQQSLDLVNFLSLVSLCFISAMSRNYYGLGAALLQALSYFAMNRIKICRIGAQDVRNYFTAGMVYLSCKALILAEERWVMCSGLLSKLKWLAMKSMFMHRTLCTKRTKWRFICD